mmetsp:Transcript_54575/g.118754  ORF Transcript_54575/g.118754 Transcript_54575/m.118754 type:complete len:132 (-) Transcript_54575:48-443(-)
MGKALWHTFCDMSHLSMAHATPSPLCAATPHHDRTPRPCVSCGQAKEPRTARWVFSTDGVGFPVPVDSDISVPKTKDWVTAGTYHYPAMFGLGAGYEHNTHKVGECVDSREMRRAIAFYTRFPSVFAAHKD